ncbi:MAG: hypothetical protein V1872_12065 [bacterium]
MSIYIELTKKFNQGKLRTIICSGQAVVLHHLAIMSKDGDWIVHEDEESLSYILKVLSDYKAHYRFGAPFDICWMKGGWSSHFEFSYNKLRIRTDFFTRPPRILDFNRIWEEHEYADVPFVKAKDLARLKKTNREKDYVVIGELARLMENPKEQLLYARSARDILSLAARYPQLVDELAIERPLIKRYPEGRERLEELLDAEKRQLIHENERRLAMYMNASEEWMSLWPSLSKRIEGKSLLESHKIIAEEAEGILPFTPMEVVGNG